MRIISRSGLMGIIRGLGAVSCFVIAVTAQAQSQPPQASPGLEEIVVTAQKREERLQDVPIAITAVDGKNLTASGVEDTRELSILVPSLSMPNTLGFLQPRIRGVGTGANGPGIENPVATYVDGVYLAAAPATLISLNDVDRIETLKGPQGTLFGRNATGGLINVVTRNPTSEPIAEVSAGYGNFATTSASAYLSGPFSDSLAGSIDAQGRWQGDGYGTNFATGRDTNRTDHDVSARSKLLYKADATTVALGLDYSNTKGSYPSPRGWEGNLPAFGPPVPGTAWDTNGNVDFANRFEGGGASLRIEQKFTAGTLVSISAYRRSIFAATFDVDFTPTPALEVALEEHDRQFSQELQFLSASDSTVKWVVGAYYFDANAAAAENTVFFGGPLTLPSSPTFPISAIASPGTQTTRSLAGFGQVTVPVAERTNITAGLRYTNEKRTVEAQESGFIIGDIPIGPLAAPVHDEKTFNDPTWRLAVDHHLSDDTMLYASYNRGFKSGGFNVLAFGSPAYEPEKLDAYEIGFKSEFLEHRLRANIATFYYDYKNIQVPYYTPLGEAGIKNGPKAKIYGVDGDLVAAVTEQFTLTAGFSALHDRFQSYPNAVFNIIIPAGGAIQTTGDATGNRLPFTPDWTVDVVADYTVPISFGALSFNVTYLHSDGFFSEADNLRHQDPYDTINALVKLAANHDRYSVSLWGKNLLNDAVVTQLSGTSAGTAATYQPPRTYGITLGAKF